MGIMYHAATIMNLEPTTAGNPHRQFCLAAMTHATNFACMRIPSLLDKLQIMYWSIA